MLIKTRAIVLHSIKFGESQYIVDMFVEETGRVAFIQKVLPSGRGKIRKQLFQPLSLLDIEFDLRPKVRLQRLKEARLLVPYATIPFDPYKLSLTIFVAEFLLHVTRNEQQNKAYAHEAEVSGSKKAVLDYRLLSSSDRYHLLEVHLHTGRHHQIRCQLATIGCVIKGDLKYGARRSNPDGSISLHARHIEFEHPVSHQTISVDAPYPEGLWNVFRS